MRSTSSHSFVFISDTHIGNHYGICTPAPDLGLETTSYYEPNDRQVKLYNGFIKCRDQLKQPQKIRALFLGGDMVDGNNPRKPGKDLWTNDPLVAVYDFNKLLWPVASKADKVFLVRGSDYHVAPDRSLINYDELAAQMIGSDPFNTRTYDVQVKAQQVQQLVKSGKKLKDIKLSELENITKPWEKNHHLQKKLQRDDNIFKKEVESLKQGQGLNKDQRIAYPRSGVRFKGIFNGIAFTVKHYVSFSPNYAYRSTGLIRNDVINSLQKSKHWPNGYEKIINAYGHAHYYHQSGNMTHYNFVVPCFKANDSYLNASGVTEPDYGIVEVIVESNNEVIVYCYGLLGDDYPVEEPYDLAN